MKRTLEATIAELSPGGEGVAIAEVDGERRAVFVPAVARGERVRVEVDLSRRPARGRLLEVLEPAAARVVPACAHVDRCGGCDWMHLTSDAQRAEHAAIVTGVLPVEVPVRTHPASRAMAYRTRARLHVEATRGRVTVGFHGRRSREAVAIDECIVLDPALEAARRALSTWLAGARGRGEALLSLGTPDAVPRRAVLDLRWNGDLPGELFAALERAVTSSVLAGARVFAGAVKTPATIGDPTPWIRGADGAPLALAPGGFSQASEEGNAALARRVAELAAELAPAGSQAVELYSGAGNLTVLLARTFSVLAVESDGDACSAARANLAARGLAARVVEADAARHPLPPGTKLMVLDPPRTGAKEVARAIAASRGKVPAIVYVSCDPPTLGRDLATLVECGYELRAVETFEMFPQTSHVEAVATLVRTRPR